jgi:hypothetical protein
MSELWFFGAFMEAVAVVYWINYSVKKYNKETLAGTKASEERLYKAMEEWMKNEN